MVFKEQTDEGKPINRFYTCTCHFINNYVCLKGNKTWSCFRVTELLNT